MNLRESQPSGAISVGELTSDIKEVLEATFDEVLVKGEISNYKQHTSGHRYFTLKDERAQISCVMWRTRNLTFVPTDGMNVVVGGKVTVYPPRGNYQFDCMFMRPDGVGALYQAYEKLKAELEKRGWFDETRKRALPRFPQCVGIATSSTGAALQDMLTTINRRYAPLRIILRPTLVQGDGSAEDIAKAIAELQNSDAEVIIIARGGGSIEDLWSFNTEVVASAIVKSALPVISAVGHETDFTIADFVADKRAATPTAAAELVTPKLAVELMQWIDDVEQQISDTLIQRFQDLQELVEQFTKGTVLLRIEERLLQMSDNIKTQMQRQRSAVQNQLDITTQEVRFFIERQLASIANRLQLLHQRTIQFQQHLQSLHPQRPLMLGFALIRRNDSPLSAEEPLGVGDNISIIRWTDEAGATITSVTKKQEVHHG